MIDRTGLSVDIALFQWIKAVRGHVRNENLGPRSLFVLLYSSRDCLVNYQRIAYLAHERSTALYNTSTGYGVHITLLPP